MTDEFDPFKPKTPNKDNIIIPDNTPFKNQYKGEVALNEKGFMIKLPKVQGAELTDEIPKSMDPEYRHEISTIHYYLFKVNGIKMYEKCDNVADALSLAMQDLALNDSRVKVVSITDKNQKTVYTKWRIGQMWEKTKLMKTKFERNRITVYTDLM